MIGKSIYDLDTPTLLLDYDKFNQNLQEMSQFARMNNIHLRPHIKTHKSIDIAKKQMEAGAVGITVAKISEAEVMAQAGIRDIFIAYPISSSQKLSKLIELTHRATVKVGVDSIDQAIRLQQAFEREAKTLEVWIKVNAGLNRCGVEPGQDVVNLAKEIKQLSNLDVTGLYTHAGHSYAASSKEEIEKIGLYEGQVIVESAAMCEQEGMLIKNRSVGSTPTYQISGKIKGITEVRPGNAIFFDAIQAGLGVTTLDRCALSLLSSVVSVYDNRIIFDAGSKSLNLDQGAHGNQSVRGFGHIVNHEELIMDRLSEEHGIAAISDRKMLKITDKVQIIPNHACTVVNLFNKIVVHQKEKVVDIWDVHARGCVN